MKKFYLIYNSSTGEIIDIKKSKDKPNNSIEISKKQYFLYKTNNNLKPKYYNKEKNLLIFDDLDKIKNQFILKLKKDFNNVQFYGYLSKTINKKINAKIEDLNNMKILLNYMKNKNLINIKFRLYFNDFINVTQKQLENMIEELEEYGIEIYQRKWNIENKIKNAKNFKELFSIQWNNFLELNNVS